MGNKFEKRAKRRSCDNDKENQFRNEAQLQSRCSGIGETANRAIAKKLGALFRPAPNTRIVINTEGKPLAERTDMIPRRNIYSRAESEWTLGSGGLTERSVATAMN